MGAPFTICLALAALGAAVGAELKAREALRQGEWQLARAQAHAQTYVQTFDGGHIDQQLAAFAERRTSLALAARWEQGRHVAGGAGQLRLLRSEGRRGGEECRSRWWP